MEVVSPIVDEGNLEIDDAGSIEGVQPDKMSPVETLALSRRGGNKKPKKKKMKILFWNVRGLGNSARRGLLKEMIKLRDIDIVGLQETKRENFSNRELNSFQGSKTFSWAWKASRGASGGILLGVNTDKVELIRNHVGAYFLSCVIRHKFNQKTWEIVVVYGPVTDSLKQSFLSKLSWHLQDSPHPFIIGGDFNPYRFAKEKSNSNLDFRAMDLFNSFILDMDLSELHRSGARFMFTNKQDYPTQEVLDRVLVSQLWEAIYPISTLLSITRIGSDHSPLILDTGEQLDRPPHYFKFESAWLCKEGFIEMVKERMIPRDKSYILEFWNKKQVDLRRFLKGLERNIHNTDHLTKKMLQQNIMELDLLADVRELSSDEWSKRYDLESNLEKINEMEELFWHKRCGDQQLLLGDRNTEFFHRMANGRRRKCNILSLEDEGREINDKNELKAHIVDYYKSLFRADPPSSIHLATDVWASEFCLHEVQKVQIIRPFTLEELEKVIREAKLNTAPGPDGFNVHFYRTFWPEVKNDLFEMLLMLFNDQLDLKRLNF